MLLFVLFILENEHKKNEAAATQGKTASLLRHSAISVPLQVCIGDGSSDDVLKNKFE